MRLASHWAARTSPTPLPNPGTPREAVKTSRSQGKRPSMDTGTTWGSGVPSGERIWLNSISHRAQRASLGS